MTVRRLIFASVCLIVSVTVVAAQPTEPAPDPAAPPPDGAGSNAGTAVEMTEDLPPADMDGTDENPDAPKTIGGNVAASVTMPMKPKAKGYPIQEALRPITLPRNMSEVAIGPHAQLGLGDGPYIGSDALRARYGITHKVQLGLTYALGGVYDDPATLMTNKLGFHPGKAVGLDLTVMVKEYLGVRLGVPIWIDRPVAVGLSLGAPIKFTFGDKFAIGGLDDVLNISLYRFAPSFEQEAFNAGRAAADDINTTLSRGYIRFAGYGVYQRDAKTALIGRIGVTLEDFATTGTGDRGLTTFLRAGIMYTPRKYLDLGVNLGFDDLSELSTFGPGLQLAFRI